MVRALNAQSLKSFPILGKVSLYEIVESHIFISLCWQLEMLGNTFQGKSYLPVDERVSLDGNKKTQVVKDHRKE